MPGVLFLIFQCLASASAKEERGGEAASGDDMGEDGWVSKKGEVPKFILFFPLDFLSVVTYLLFRHACNVRYETNVWVHGWVKKGGCLEILRQLWTDGLPSWISHGYLILTLQVPSHDCRFAWGKEGRPRVINLHFSHWKKSLNYSQR